MPLVLSRIIHSMDFAICQVKSVEQEAAEKAERLTNVSQACPN